MRISELRSYRSKRRYRFTPLFWKLSISTAILVISVILCIAFNFGSSVSVASASDIEKNRQNGVSKDAYAFPDEQKPERTNASAEGLALGQDPLGTGTTSAVTATNSGTSTNPKSGNASVDFTEAKQEGFASTAFIGDSRTEGLLLYSGIQGATDYALKGLNLKSVFSNAFIVDSSGKKITILSDMQNKSFDKIYISFGLNELGWNSDTYAAKYSQLVNEIRAMQPSAVIYLQSTFPINPERCKFDQNTNKRIREMNGQVSQIASQTSNTYYLDLYPQFEDERGYLVLDASSDGIHLNKKYCTYWLQRLEKNTDEMSAPASLVPTGAGLQQVSESAVLSKSGVSPGKDAALSNPNETISLSQAGITSPIKGNTQEALKNNETTGDNFEIQ